MKIDRSILQANNQEIGQFGDPNKIENSIEHVANVVDENDNGFNAHKNSTELAHPDKSVTERKLADLSVSRRTIKKGAVGYNELDDSLIQFYGDIAIKAKLDEHDAEFVQLAKKNPVAFYAPEDSILIPRGGYNVVGDPDVIDDRNGETGKVWIFYYTVGIENGTSRRSADKLSAISSEWSEEQVVAINGGGSTGIYKVGFYPKKVNGKWYAAATRGASDEIIIISFDRLDGNMTVEKIITTKNGDGNSTFVDNGNLWYDEENGIWHVYWSTFINGFVGIRHASCATINGTWSIDNGLFIAPTDVAPEVKWVRFFSITEFPDGTKCVTFGAGTYPPPTPGEDREAKVYIGKFTGFTTKPIDVNLVLDPLVYPTSTSYKFSSSLVKDNIYAPRLVYDTVENKPIIFANTGAYGQEDIIRFNWNAPYSWAVGRTTDGAASNELLAVTSEYQPVPWCEIWLPEGVYNVEVTGQAFLNNSVADLHNQDMHITDLETIFGYSVIGIGGYAWESKSYQNISCSIRVPKLGRKLYVKVKAERDVPGSQFRLFKARVTPII